MAKLEVKSIEGKKVGSVELNQAFTDTKPVATVLHRTVIAEEANRRQGTQSAKTRSETRGGGRKPYKQKKTGNARQGTIRAPHYAHGGMAFAVKPRDYDKKVNRKERRAAIVGAFVAKVEAGDVVVADSIVFTEPKTKMATEMIKALDLAGARRLLVVLPVYDEVTYKCFRNLPNVVVRTAPTAGEDKSKTATFSTRDLIVAHKVLIVKEALVKMQEVWAK